MSKVDDTADLYMQRAIALAEKGRFSTPPNPWVGCVVVKDGKIVGEGYHVRAGEPHAEVMALRQAGPHAQGAHVYVNLEPCGHHGRTPPCAHALIDAKVHSVYTAIEDPDPRVKGHGVHTLRAAGIPVHVGVGAAEATASLLPYLHHRKTGRPYCVVKAAISIDGRIAAQDGSSKWITSPAARADAHLLRGQSQAILVGAGTALKDQPSLTVRDVDIPLARQPLRVLIDSQGRVPAQGPLFDRQMASTLIFTTPQCPTGRREEWLQAGCEVEVVSEGIDKSVSIEDVLDHLGSKGILQLLVEGGAAIQNRFFSAGLVDRLVLYVGACLLGPNGLPFSTGDSAPNIEVAPRLRLVDVRRLCDDVCLEYRTRDEV